jgi:hypothetical protein
MNMPDVLSQLSAKNFMVMAAEVGMPEIQMQP